MITIYEQNTTWHEDKLKQFGNLYKLEVQPLEGKKDIVGTKVLKVFEYLKKQAKLNILRPKSISYFSQISILNMVLS